MAGKALATKPVFDSWAPRGRRGEMTLASCQPPHIHTGHGSLSFTPSQHIKVYLKLFEGKKWLHLLPKQGFSRVHTLKSLCGYSYFSLPVSLTPPFSLLLCSSPGSITLWLWASFALAQAEFVKSKIVTLEQFFPSAHAGGRGAGSGKGGKGGGVFFPWM